MNFESLRHSMVDRQLRARGIRDAAVLHAMETVPRHEFVPLEEQKNAYNDSPLDIGKRQTISQPYIVAFMTELLKLEPGHRVLEVGTGSGYQTAILAMLSAEVFTIEVHAELQSQARERLERLGFSSIRYDIRNGHFGWAEEAPFDRIMVTAAALTIPQPLIDQLGEGGRMVIPAGPSLEEQILKVVVKLDAFRVDIRNSVPVRFVPLL